jgi:hypothetical protein
MTAPLVLLAVVYLFALWVATSLIAGKGMLLFGLGLAALAWALRRARRGERQALYRAFFIVVLAAATVMSLEAVLAFLPGLLHGRVANYTFGRYHAERGGIYQLDPYVGRTLRPDFRCRAYWNGYWWTHQTNADGYRGQRLARADAVLLGDSMVYGHGVEEHDTVPAQLSRLSGLTVANLGQPGIGLVQALALFRAKGLPLRPRRVFVCVHYNDAQDTLDAYPPSSLEAFVRRPDELPLVRPELRQPPPSGLFDRWARHVALPLLGARLVNGLRGKPDWALEAPAPPHGGGPSQPFLPTVDERDGPYAPLHAGASPELRLAWRANRAALAELVHAADAEVVVFDLGYPREFSEAVETMAREIGATYSPAGREALARALAREPVYLPDDGHWTGLGCRMVASELRQRIDSPRGDLAITRP